MSFFVLFFLWILKFLLYLLGFRVLVFLPGLYFFKDPWKVVFGHHWPFVCSWFPKGKEQGNPFVRKCFGEGECGGWCFRCDFSPLTIEHFPLSSLIFFPLFSFQLALVCPCPFSPLWFYMFLEEVGLCTGLPERVWVCVSVYECVGLFELFWGTEHN